MAVKVSGDFAQKMDRWAQLLESSSVIVRHTSQVQAEVALTLIGEGFDRETDPYGRRWEPKKKPDGRKTLHGETTRLRNGWHITRSSMGGWQVDPSVEYAVFHQEPIGNARPTRRMVPSTALGLPAEWKREFRAVAIAAAIEHFKEAAASVVPKFMKRTRSAPTGASAPASKPQKKRGGVIRTLRRLRSRVF